MHVYEVPVDFSDLAEMTIYRSDGVQEALRASAEALGCGLQLADDGIVLALESERELSAEEIAGVGRALSDGWERYLATK